MKSKKILFCIIFIHIFFFTSITQTYSFPASTTWKNMSDSNKNKAPIGAGSSMKEQFGTTTYKLPTSLMHAYSKRLVWNIDDSLLMLGEKIVDAKTFKTVKSIPVSGSRVWSNTNANTLYGFSYRSGKFQKVNARTGSMTLVKNFGNYGKCTIGDYEGNLSNDDQFVLVKCDNTLISYNIKKDAVLGTIKAASNFNWGGFVQSGKYIVIENSASGTSREFIRYDQNLKNKKVISTFVEHGDFGRDKNGDDVYVMTGWDYIRSLRIKDGQMKKLAGSPASHGHMSCRNIYRPGYCYFSASSGLAIGSVNLDSGKIEYFGFHRSKKTDYNSQAQASVNTRGTKLIYTSNWYGKSKLNDYITSTDSNNVAFRAATSKTSANGGGTTSVASGGNTHSNVNPKANWADSYSKDGQCYCATTYDHGIAGVKVNTPQGQKTVKEICQKIGSGPGKGSNPVYNDIQCGNGPANDAVIKIDGKNIRDEVVCPGRVDKGSSGCQEKGPTWNLGKYFPSNSGNSQNTAQAQTSSSNSVSGTCSSKGASLSQAQSNFANQCKGYTRKDCDPQGSDWLCSSAAIGNAVIYNVSSNSQANINSQATNTTSQSSNPVTIGKYRSGDLIALHYDHAPDKDDGHAAAAGYSIVDQLNLNYIVISGAYGDGNKKTYDSDAEKVMQDVFGNNWLNAHKNWNSSVDSAANRWAQVLKGGKSIHVAEGGQADFTADVIRKLKTRNDLNGINLKNKINVVQHSKWNENQANKSDLAYVKNQASYTKIEDGNFTNNGTAGLKMKSDSFVNTAKSSKYSKAWNSAFNYLDPKREKLDFSDTVELLHILGIGTNKIKDIADFADMFLKGKNTGIQIDSYSSNTINTNTNNNSSVSEGNGGLIVFEAENSSSDLGKWIKGTDLKGYSGNGYITFNGNSPKNGPATSPLKYTFTADKSGEYRLMMRIQRKNIDGHSDYANDGYIRLEGDFTAGNGAPATSMLKENQKYYGGNTSWAWSPNAPIDANHKKWKATYNLKAGQKYTLVLSGRSQFWSVDRIVFAHSSVNDNTAKGANQSQISQTNHTSNSNNSNSNISSNNNSDTSSNNNSNTANNGNTNNNNANSVNYTDIGEGQICKKVSKERKIYSGSANTSSSNAYINNNGQRYVPSSGACYSQEKGLQTSRSVFAQRCAGRKRVDCDPIQGGDWVCSTEQIGLYTPGNNAGTNGRNVNSGNTGVSGSSQYSIEKYTEFVCENIDSGTNTGGATSTGTVVGPCSVSELGLESTKIKYDNTCGGLPLDCDSVSNGQWICASYMIEGEDNTSVIPEEDSSSNSGGDTNTGGNTTNAQINKIGNVGSIKKIHNDFSVSGGQTNTQMETIDVRDGKVYVAYIKAGPQGDGSKKYHQLVVEQGTQKNGTWSWKSKVIDNRVAYDLWHNAPSIIVDKKGYIHVAYNMHNLPWQYQISNKPHDISEFTFKGQKISETDFKKYYLENRTGFPSHGTAAIPGNQITYPAFFRDMKEDIYITYRFAAQPKRSFSDRMMSSGISKYNPTTKKWTAIGSKHSGKSGVDYTVTPGAPSYATVFAGKQGWTAYLPQLAFDKNNTMHFAGVWKEGKAGSITGIPCYVKSQNQSTFQSAQGKNMTLPIRPENCPNITTVPKSQALGSITSFAVSANGTPYYLVIHRNNGAKIHSYSGGKWNMENAPGDAHELFADKQGNLYAINRGLQIYKKSNGGAWEKIYSGGQKCTDFNRVALNEDTSVAYIHTHGCTTQSAIFALQLNTSSNNTSSNNTSSSNNSQGTTVNTTVNLGGKSNLQKIPGKMDNLYKYNVNSTSDLLVYKDGRTGKMKQLLSYFAEDRRLHIVSRDFPDGKWGSPIDVHSAIGNDKLEYDSHNNSAMGIAPDGTIFITANHHVDPLRMALTSKPYDLSTFKRLPSGSINGNDDDRVTYPSFSYLNNELIFSYREQEAGGGQPKFRWLVKKWNTKTKKWDDGAQFNTGTHLRFYTSNIHWTPDKKTIHITGVWRDDTRGGGVENQHDLVHMYSTDSKNWKQYGYNGNLKLPLIWRNKGDTTVPQKIWNSGKGDPTPQNAGSIALDSKGYPHIINKQQGGKSWYHRYDGNKWISKSNVFSSSSDDIFKLGNDMGAVSHKDGNIYFHLIRNGNVGKGVLISKGLVNSTYVLSVDKTAIDYGWLSIMLTKAKHAAPRTVTGVYPVDAHVLSIPLDSLK